MAKDEQNRVHEYVQQALATGELAAGCKLPAERELAKRLGTSRATVRQALDVLEARHQVTRHVGRGTFVAHVAPEHDPRLGSMGDERAHGAVATVVEVSPAELIQARQLFEPQAAELVVLNATEGDVRELRRIAEAQRHLTEGAVFEESDIQFHRMLARATHNDLVVAMANLIVRARRQPDWLKLKDVAARRNGGPRPGAIDEHLEVVIAIEARDSVAAGRAMRRHLEHVRRNLLGG